MLFSLFWPLCSPLKPLWSWFFLFLTFLWVINSFFFLFCKTQEEKRSVSETGSGQIGPTLLRLIYFGEFRYPICVLGVDLTCGLKTWAPADSWNLNFGWVALILCQAGSKGAGPGGLERTSTRSKLGMLLERAVPGSLCLSPCATIPSMQGGFSSIRKLLLILFSVMLGKTWEGWGWGWGGIPRGTVGILPASLSAWQHFSCSEFPDLDHHRPEQLLSPARPELTTGKGVINLDYFGICRSLLEL